MIDAVPSIGRVLLVSFEAWFNMTDRRTLFLCLLFVKVSVSIRNVLDMFLRHSMAGDTRWSNDIANGLPQ